MTGFCTSGAEHLGSETRVSSTVMSVMSVCMYVYLPVHI
jgi:hypothetical protein